jgi:hypothetical protein
VGSQILDELLFLLRNAIEELINDFALVGGVSGQSKKRHEEEPSVINISHR